MINLSNFHPLLTANYRLDFLSYLAGKDIQKLLQLDITQTSSFINQSMRAIMENLTLTWGVSTQKDNQLLGIVQVDFSEQETATIKTIFYNKIPQEILVRIQQLFQAPLTIKTVLISPQSTNQLQLNNFFNNHGVI